VYERVTILIYYDNYTLFFLINNVKSFDMHTYFPLI